MDGYAMLREIADLGFEYAELSHGIRIVLVPGILRAVQEGVIKISSTHNFCPLPTGVVQPMPNLFEPSAPEHKEHDQWLRHTKRSIEFASQVNSKVLVCHLGSVRFFLFNPARKIRMYLRDNPGAGHSDDARYKTLVARSLAKLQKRKEVYWDQVQASIREVTEHAAKHGVTLGFENREKFEELPMDSDFPAFIGGFPASAPIGYWHDAGHADIKESMGMIDHKEHLTANAARLIGFHLHDVSAQGQDHQAIGKGHIDFKMVSSFWKPEHRLVIELSPRVSVDDVRASKERVEALVSNLG